MFPNFDFNWVVRASEQLGINLIFLHDFLEESSLAGSIHTFVFETHGTNRKLEISIGEREVTFVVKDEEKKRRAVYGRELKCVDSIENFVACFTAEKSLIESLKGAEVVDTLFDWRGYK